ncbi:MAG: hypothetical protein IJ723_05945, partial [Ruminococcus sp.]|nr:hypothetical protein [Ruminococcus sp.]
MMKMKLTALAAAAALMLCGCGSKTDIAKQSGTEQKTLAQQLSDRLDGGEYDITMRVSGTLYESEMSCHMWGRDGDGVVAMDDNGVHTEFCTVDGETYMLVPDVKC